MVVLGVGDATRDGLKEDTGRYRKIQEVWKNGG
jgi:hypothetical protein